MLQSHIDHSRTDNLSEGLKCVGFFLEVEGGGAYTISGSTYFGFNGGLFFHVEVGCLCTGLTFFSGGTDFGLNTYTRSWSLR
jgi:hypothetical protein